MENNNPSSAVHTEGVVQNPTGSTTPNSTAYIRPTRDSIISDETRGFISSLDPSTTDTREVANALVHRTNLAIEEANQGSRVNRYPHLVSLTPRQVSELLIALRHVIRIVPSGRSADPDSPMLGIYSPPDGLYATSRTAVDRAIYEFNSEATSTYLSEVRVQLSASAPMKEESADSNLLAVANGIFDYRSKTLMPFSPEFVFRIKIAVDFNPNAENPIITMDDGTQWDVESWMLSLQDDPEVVDLLWEVVGASLRPGVRWEKAVLLHSMRGNNGKSTLCALMRAVLGADAHASISLSQMSSRFGLSDLPGIQAIIVDENETNSFADNSANLKSLVTGDVVSVERKHKPSISMQWKGLIVQCVNAIPRSRDKTNSLYRRQLFIPFPKDFSGNGVQRPEIKEDYLHRREVLEYVVRRVLTLMPDYYRFSEPEACRALLEEAKVTNDPKRQFWQEVREEFVWDFLPYEFIYDLYAAWSKRSNPSGTAEGRHTFSRDLKQMIDGDPDWKHVGKKRPEKHLRRPEPLIREYDLVKWMNQNNKGSGVSKQCVPSDLKPAYSGLARTPSAASTPSTAAGPSGDI